MAATAKDSPPETTSDTAETAQTGLTRAVVWTGAALGTCAAVLAMTGGARLRLGAMPTWLGLAVGWVIIWALCVAAAITVAELTRRHHKTARRYAIRQGKRGAVATGRAARRGGGRLARKTRAVIGRLTEKAGARWENRQNTRAGGQAPQAPPGIHEKREGAMPGKATKQELENAVNTGRGWLTPQPEPVDPNATGGTTRMPQRPASRITPDRRARRTAASTGGTIPDAWGPVVAQAADFEPESDAHLLAWMTGQVTGMAAYAEALIEAYETGINSVGIDPKGLTALHDVADAAALAAETMAGAKTQFADHYELPREFAAGGGLMTHDGRWVTGDGD